MEPPKVFNIPEHLIIKLECPLYGVPKAGAHWHHTYYNHHTLPLQMKPATHDPCLLYTQNAFGLSGQAKIPRGITCLQTDDTLTVCNKLFLDKKENESAAFRCKKRQQLQDKSSLRYNGANIQKFDKVMKFLKISNLTI